MDVGRRPGWVARQLLRPTGWRLAGLAVVAAVAVVAATRWPVGGVRAAVVDLRYYFEGDRFGRARWSTLTDAAYVGGLLLTGAVLIAWAARAAVRPVLRRAYRQPPVDVNRRAALLALAGAAATVAGGVLIGWPYRLARVWARRLLVAVRSGPTARHVSLLYPSPLSDDQARTMLRTGLARLPSRAERTACLALLHDWYRHDALAVVVDQLGRERDPVLRATLVRLVGLHRDPASLGVVLSFWDDPDPAVRAAAADAVGLIHAPPFPIGYAGQDALATDPPVSLETGTMDGITGGRGSDPSRSAAVDLVRDRVVARMLAGATDAERQAAARALLRWPPAGYRLRVAEWGVWVADETGAMALAQSLIDEIPPFVHRTGDAVASMADRIDTTVRMQAVAKPIVHVTVDRPLAMDVQVTITQGRPWFAFPKPDDFTVGVDPVIGYGGSSLTASPLAAFDRPSLPPLDNPREGYPWAVPTHRTRHAMSVTNIFGLGLRWQSVIASPERLPWMAPPAVPADPMFAWWERLRHVDGCAWVGSRGEAERFLYYDGPTAAVAPIGVTLKGDRLRFQRQPGTADARGLPFVPLATPAVSGRRPGLFIRVEQGRAGASVIGDVTPESGGGVRVVDADGCPKRAGEPAVAATLARMLAGAGLSDAEAAGLVDCWRPQLFRTDGRRFLLLMTAGDYDALCPIRVDPPPTQMVRVGLVLTEFGAA